MVAMRALLISLRDPTDPMAEHERKCFADRSSLPLDAVDMHPMQRGRPSPEHLKPYDAVFFGGSGAYSVLDDVDWIRAGVDLCLDVIRLQIPGYASCFGFQGLSMAMGGEVVSDAARTELGATPLQLTDAGAADSLFKILPRRFDAQEGHHDHVTRLPPGVTLLATGEVSPYQAFRVDGAPFWASQFHPELTRESTVARFIHYRDLYSTNPEEAEKTLQTLGSREDSPELAGLLARLVRHQF